MKMKLIVAMAVLAVAAQASASGRQTVTPDTHQQQTNVQAGQAAIAASTAGRATKMKQGLIKSNLLKVGAHDAVIANLETLMSQDEQVVKQVLALVKAEGVSPEIKTMQLIGISALKPGDIGKKSTDFAVGPEKARAQFAEIFTKVAPEIAKMTDPKAKAEAMEMLKLTSEAILQGKSIEEAMKNIKQDVKEMICKCSGICG